MEDKTMKNVKKSFALLFAVIFAFSALSVMAFAAAPEVVITQIGKTSVTVKPVDQCVFGWKAIGADGDYTYGTSNVIELSGSTVGYELIAKNLQSNALSTVVTISAAPATPSKPEYVTCSATTITMKADSKLQYKAFNTELGYETEWFDENVITGLRKDTVYSVIARNKVGENQLLGEESEANLIRTAKRDAFTGKKEDCRVDLIYEGSVTKGAKIKVTAVGSYIDAATSNADTTPIEGDVRFIPMKWYAKQADTGIIVANGEWTSSLTVKSDVVDTSSVTVEKGKGPVDVRVEVEFVQQQYVNGSWKTISKYVDSNTFPVSPGSTNTQKITQIFTGIINLATKALLTFFKLINQFLTRPST